MGKGIKYDNEYIFRKEGKEIEMKDRKQRVRYKTKKVQIKSTKCV